MLSNLLALLFLRKLVKKSLLFAPKAILFYGAFTLKLRFYNMRVILLQQSAKIQNKALRIIFGSDW